MKQSACSHFLLMVGVLIAATSAALAADEQKSLGQRIVAFCSQQKDQLVGDGQCSTLVHEAFKSAGAKRRPQEDNPAPGDYVWGKLVLVVSGGPDGLKIEQGHLYEVRPGDVMQFRDVQLTHLKTGNFYSTKRFDHHSAVVAGVTPTRKTINVWQQNWGDKKTVMYDTLLLGEMTQGYIRFYHPIEDDDPK